MKTVVEFTVSQEDLGRILTHDQPMWLSDGTNVYYGRMIGYHGPYVEEA